MEGRICLQMAKLNAQVGQAQYSLDMLTGAGAYAGLANQIVLDPMVYLQMAAAATKAWKALPNKAMGISCQNSTRAFRTISGLCG